MSIYVEQLRDLKSAEDYCDRIYSNAKDDINNEDNNNNDIGNNYDENNDNNNNNSNSDNNNYDNINGNDKNNDVIDKNIKMREQCKERRRDAKADLGVYLSLLEIMIRSIPATSSSSSPPFCSEKIKINNNYNNDNSSDKLKENTKTDPNENLFFEFNEVIKLAERCHDKIDAFAFLSLIPKTLPLFMIEKYLRIVIEYGNHKKRNLMVNYFSIKFQ